MSDAGAPRPLLDLPEMTATVLDVETVKRLFAEIAFEASVMDILVRGGESLDVGEPAPKHTLRGARDVFLSGAVSGLQIRYEYVGMEWWDTLMRSGDVIRLVRVRK